MHGPCASASRPITANWIEEWSCGLMAHGLIWQMAHQIAPWIHCLKCVRMRLYNSIETDTPQKHPLNNLGLHKDEDWKVEGRRRQGLGLSPLSTNPSPICLAWWSFSPCSGSSPLLFIGNLVLSCLSLGYCIPLRKWTFVDASGAEPALWNSNYHLDRLSQFHRQSRRIRLCTWLYVVDPLNKLGEGWGNNCCFMCYVFRLCPYFTGSWVWSRSYRQVPHLRQCHGLTRPDLYRTICVGTALLWNKPWLAFWTRWYFTLASTMCRKYKNREADSTIQSNMMNKLWFKRHQNISNCLYYFTVWQLTAFKTFE